MYTINVRFADTVNATKQWKCIDELMKQKPQTLFQLLLEKLCDKNKYNVGSIQ